ncbi:MAG: DNA-binding protein [Deltaproteobacteria bacterium HGW-Deltaproteobacteria-10]|jgi:excisionase family DNA binding protein|nr:MAG: DNA-binding protein [Deltaproteobacteria bacterium HGW-Deltaproteobacteria-10]
MSQELMNTKEVAQYLDIHEKQVYLLIKAGKIPCTRVTGKWIFPVKLIDEWIQTSAQDFLQQARKKINSIAGSLLAAGSNDPILDMLLTAIKKDYPTFNIFSSNTGSVNGLEALNTGLTDIAFSHLYDAASGDYNIPYLKQYCPNQSPVVVNLFYRQIGFLVAKSKSKIFKGWDSLTQKNIRFVNRQKGSGIRVLLDQELKERGIICTDISGYDTEVYTHFEVGLCLISGEADTGIASAAVARILDLDFHPLVDERFDMILEKNTFFQPAVQAFIETLQSEKFKNRVEKIGNYDFTHAGKILYS